MVTICPHCGYNPYLKEGYKKAINKYRKECKKIEEEFKKDALTHVGVSIHHPKANKLYDIAWNEMHSDGLESIVIFMEELAELID